MVERGFGLSEPSVDREPSVREEPAIGTAISLCNVVSPAPRDRWESLFREDPEAVPYQSPAWVDAMCRVGNHKDSSRLYSFGDGTEMLLPVVEHKWVPRSLSLSGSMPWGWGMGGLVSAQPVGADHVRAVVHELTGCGYLRMSVRPNPRSGAVWRQAVPDVVPRVARRAHVIDLSGGFDEVWRRRFSASTRKYVKKAQAAGVVVECDHGGRLIPAYYELFHRATERWARQQHEPLPLARLRGHHRDPERKFRMIAQAMGDACRYYVAFIDGLPVAACLVLQYQNVNAARVVLDRERIGRTGAADLMMKCAIEAACQAGCRYFHQGESGTSTGISDFKRRLGGEAFSYEEYYLERLPVTAADHAIRAGVKRLIRFRD